VELFAGDADAVTRQANYTLEERLIWIDRIPKDDDIAPAGTSRAVPANEQPVTRKNGVFHGSGWYSKERHRHL